ncbi:MAG: DUF11 domain-containing protein [Clostridia bacterium]|nr:DUF11 domain-containing protein [Clostridia bacterium]
MSYSISKVLRADKTSAKEGETVHNTVTVTNNSTTRLVYTFISNPTPEGATYVAGSVKVNGVTQPIYDPVKGFPLPELNPGDTVAIEYTIKPNEPIPTTPITHFATLKYKVTDPIRGDVSYAENTETLSINVISDKISVVKKVDKAFAVAGEKLHYTITVVNSGNVIKNDLIFKDPIPEGATFVSNSVKIDGVSYPVYHPEIGFALRSLTPDNDLTIEFDVKVN